MNIAEGTFYYNSVRSVLNMLLIFTNFYCLIPEKFMQTFIVSIKPFTNYCIALYALAFNKASSESFRSGFEHEIILSKATYHPLYFSGSCPLQVYSDQFFPSAYKLIS